MKLHQLIDQLTKLVEAAETINPGITDEELGELDVAVVVPLIGTRHISRLDIVTKSSWWDREVNKMNNTFVAIRTE